MTDTNTGLLVLSALPWAFAIFTYFNPLALRHIAAWADARAAAIDHQARVKLKEQARRGLTRAAAARPEVNLAKP